MYMKWLQERQRTSSGWSSFIMGVKYSGSNGINPSAMQYFACSANAIARCRLKWVGDSFSIMWNKSSIACKDDLITSGVALDGSETAGYKHTRVHRRVTPVSSDQTLPPGAQNPLERFLQLAFWSLGPLWQVQLLTERTGAR